MVTLVLVPQNNTSLHIFLTFSMVSVAQSVIMKYLPVISSKKTIQITEDSAL